MVKLLIPRSSPMRIETIYTIETFFQGVQKCNIGKIWFKLDDPII